MQIELRRSILSGRIRAAPGRAYAHRALAAASFSPGHTLVSNLPPGDDIAATVEACRGFGADIVTAEGVADIFCDPRLLSAPLGVSCRESNTTLKLFMPIAAAFETEVGFSCSAERASQLVAPFTAFLSRCGAEVAFQGNEGQVPFSVKGPMKEEEMVYYARMGTQFLSGLLLAAPLREKDSAIIVAGHMGGWHFVEETISLLEMCGVEFESKSSELVALAGDQPYNAPLEIRVPGSTLRESFFLAAGALCGKVEVEGLPAAARLESVMKSFGAGAKSEDGLFTASAEPLSSPGEVDARQLGSFLLPAVVLAAGSSGETKFTGMGFLEVRQRARALTLLEELSKMGARVETYPDAFVISGKVLSGTEVDCQGDARVGMALAAACLAAKGSSRLLSSECIEREFPGFFRDMASLGAIMREAL
jgi:3-phosphoshikimate 1-carboxyvinyltransferase